MVNINNSPATIFASLSAGVSGKIPAVTFLQQAALHRAGTLLGSLKIGDVLPSERIIADQTRLGRSVVRGLYQSLSSEGHLAREDGRWILKRRLPRTRKDASEDLPLTKRQLVKSHLIAGLSSGGWREGERISELALSHKLGVSTVTVREALLEFQPLGLITKRDRQKWEVVAFREQRIRHLREFREMVEVFALRKLLGSDIAENSRAAFLNNQARTRKVLAAVRPHSRAMLEVDLEFHRLLLDAADNPLLKERADFIYSIIEFQLMSPRFRVERGRLGLRQHLKILKAILAGNLAGAESNLRLHLDAAVETFRQVAATA